MGDTEEQNQEWTLPVGGPCDILLVGKTGHGKSSVGNSLLGREHFETSSGTDSHTEISALGRFDVDHRTITVCDTPGLCDTRMGDPESDEQFITAVVESLTILCEKGFHAILVVLQSHIRLTDEELGSIRKLEEMLGGCMLQDYGVVVFTGGDSFAARTKNMSLGEWCRKQKGSLGKLLDACQGRCVLFDNLTTDEVKLKQQRCQLIKMIDELQEDAKRFTSSKFELVQNGWRKAIEEGGRPDIVRQVYLDLGQISTELNNMIYVMKKFDKTIADNLRERLISVRSSISRVDENTRNELNPYIQSLEDALDGYEQSGDDWTGTVKRIGTLTAICVPIIEALVRSNIPQNAGRAALALARTGRCCIS